MAFVDGSVTNVALPAIGKSVGASGGDLAWIINAYLLPLSALLLLGGAIGDHFGRRRTLIAGVLLFAAASIGCSLAPSLDVLLVSRAVQGIGAALLMPNSLGILGNAFEGELRGRAVGTWAAAGAIAGAVGPPLGGWLVGTVGWRSIFYLNIPLALATIAIASAFVAESKGGDQPLDWRGAALATLALGSLTWGLTLWSAGNAGVWAIGSAAAGCVLLALFVLTQKQSGERAMMPLTLFASRPFVGLTALTFLLYGALGGLLVLLPYMLIVGSGYSPLQAALSLLPFSVIIGTASRFTGRLAERVGPRLPLTLGPIVTGIGYAWLAFADPQASYWASTFPGLVVIAGGMSLAVAPLTTAVLSSVDDRHTGTASGFNSAVARTGGLIATALCSSVLSATGARLAHAFDVAAVAGAVLAASAGAIAFGTLDRNPARPR